MTRCIRFLIISLSVALFSNSVLQAQEKYLAEVGMTMATAKLSVYEQFEKVQVLEFFHPVDFNPYIAISITPSIYYEPEFSLRWNLNGESELFEYRLLNNILYHIHPEQNRSTYLWCSLILQSHKVIERYNKTFSSRGLGLGVGRRLIFPNSVCVRLGAFYNYLNQEGGRHEYGINVRIGLLITRIQQ